MPSETTTACVRLLVFFRIRRSTFPYGVEDDASTIIQTPTTHYTSTCVKLTIVTHLSFSERIAIANLSFDLTAIPLSLLLHFIPLSLSLLCLPIWAVLHHLYMYMVAFLALRILYVVALVCFCFCSLFFSPSESLPGKDVLCRLLPRPLPSVCFLLFSFLFPTVFAPNLFWCNFLYLVITAGFVADQLIM